MYKAEKATIELDSMIIIIDESFGWSKQETNTLWGSFLKKEEYRQYWELEHKISVLPFLSVIDWEWLSIWSGSYRRNLLLDT